MLKKNILLLLLLLPFYTFAQQMWINEIHYDNTGGDVDEFVEVVIEDTFMGALSDIEIIFYNGSNGTIITQSEPRTLNTFDVGQNSGGFTIYSRLFPSGIQNGNPDGIALINAGSVVEFISYEGTLTASEGPASGMISVDIGVAEPGAIGQSLQLSGQGNLRSLFAWQPPATATKGLLNNNQVLADVAPQLLSTFPVDGTTGVNFSTPLQLAFTEPVNVSTASFSAICAGGSISPPGLIVSQDGDASHYIVTPNPFWPESTSCEVTVIAAQVTDVDNNNPLAGGDVSISFSTAGDSPIPTLASVNPQDGAVLIPQIFSIDVNFSENVNLTTNAITLSCPNSVPFTHTSYSNVSSVTLTPTAAVAEGAFCTVILNAINITDTDGPDFAALDGNGDGVAGGNFSFSFAIIEPIYAIYEIQGTTDISPLAGNFVRTQGDVVTAVSSSGFFMQAPEPGDSDLDTSDGIFVFSSTAVTIGDVVDVRGRAVEFNGLTELDMVSSVNIIASGATMPTPVTFDATTPSTDPTSLTCLNNFECFEGMLVSVANGVNNTGTGNFGEFMATATGSRAVRDPGIEFSQTGDSQLPTFPSATYDPDIFDENPELFEVDTNGLMGMPILELNGGSTFSATGVLTYQFGDYSLLPKQITSTPRSFDPITTLGANEIAIATQNMFRFFDDDNDPLIDDFDEDNTTTQEFTDRVTQASLYFRTKMNAPDVIVLEEIENINSVQAIATQMNFDDPSHTYSAYLIEGNDVGGIDVGMLTKETVSNVVITQLGKDEVLQFGMTGRLLHDRPPLLLNATITKGMLSRQFNILGVHARSRSGITGSQRQRIRNKHLEQALSIANMVQNLQSPTIPLVVLGDFNDFEFSDGYADVIGEIKGTADPLKNLLSSNGNSVVSPPLVNAIDTLPVTEKYSFIFRGTIQALDHVLLNITGSNFLTQTQYVRGNSDSPAQYEGNYSQLLGMSDHDGLIVYFDLNTILETIFLNGFE